LYFFSVKVGVLNVQRCKRNTNYLIQRQEANQMIGELGLRQCNHYGNVVYEPNNLEAYRPEIVHPVVNNVPTVKEKDMFNSTQTVHITSICSSVSKSIMKIKKLTQDLYIESKKENLLNQFMYTFYGSYINNDIRINWFEDDIIRGEFNFIEKILLYTKSAVSNITSYLNNETETKHYLETAITDMSIHTKTKITYSELLARVWILIKNHEHPNDFIANVKIELKSSVGMCFTGRINRLVNSLIGFIDGITVGISVKEQLQLEIGNIIAKLGKKELTYEDSVKEITLLFEDPEIKEDETVTEYYKQAWLDALEDYKPEEVTEESKEVTEESKEVTEDYLEPLLV
jgi:hypothetical protein